MPGWLRRYIASDDPRVAAANLIALVLAWNQPVYPLYLWWIVGSAAWVGLPDVLSCLFFAAVPAIARRSSVAGRVALTVFGLANVVVCMKLLGEPSGVGLFLFPCAMLAAMLFRWRERWVMLALTALPLVVWLAVRDRLGAPPVVFPADEYASLFYLNAVSAGALMVFFAWVLAPDRLITPGSETDPAEEHRTLADRGAASGTVMIGGAASDGL